MKIPYQSLAVKSKIFFELKLLVDKILFHFVLFMNEIFALHEYWISQYAEILKYNFTIQIHACITLDGKI